MKPMAPGVGSNTSQILILATFLLSFSGCGYSADDQVLYVQPVNGASCPDLPCHKLSYYVGDPKLQSQYLRSNTTLHFIPGVHIFNNEILVDIRSIENFSLVGTTSQSIILCTEPAGFLFYRVAVLSIHGLVFVNCGIDIAPLNELQTSDYLPLRATFCFSHVTHLNISQTAVINGTGHGFLALNMLGNVSIYHSILQSNKGRPGYSGGNAIFKFTPIEEECLEFKYQPIFFTVESTRIESGSTTPHDIFTASPGLFIYINSCLKVFVRIHNSLFVGNSYENDHPVFRSGGNMFLRLSHNARNSPSHFIVIENSTYAGGKSDMGGGLSISSQSKICMPASSPDIVYIFNSLVFYNVAFRSGGGMNIAFDPNSCHATQVLMNQVTIESNYAITPTMTSSGGNLAIEDYRFSSNTVTTVGNLVKIENSVISDGLALQGFGGGLSINVAAYMSFPITMPGQPGLMIQISNTTFMRNEAYYGGAISMINLNSDHGQGKLQVVNCTFENNRGGLGMAVYSYVFPSTGADSNISFEDTDFINHNSAATLVPFKQSTSTIFVYANRQMEFFNCELNHNMGTAVFAISSHLYFKGHLSFWNNTGKNGGALSLCTSSIIFLLPNTHAYFGNNHARNSGGAIYVQQECTYYGTLCFFQPVLPFSAPQSFLPASNISLYFDNNTAGRAGDALYGGSVDNCALNALSARSHALSAHSTVQSLDSVNQSQAFSIFQAHSGIDDSKIKYQESLTVFNLLFNVDNQDGLSSVSSDPLGVCFCSDEQVNCTSKWLYITPVFPGGTFTLNVVIVGQRDGVVPGVVLASIDNRVNSTTSRLGDLQNSQPVGKECSRLSYTIFSTRSSENVSFMVEDSLLSISFTPPIVHIPLRPCPPGFSLLHASGKCDCSPPLELLNITCNVTDQTILRKAPRWLGYYNSEISAPNSSNFTTKLNEGILVHDHCPYDYCKPEDLNIVLTSPDTQCAFNRSGIMCGACREGLSLVLGTSRCKQCSSMFLVLLIPFIIAGVALVFLLTVLNLTVSEGMLNGLIFYANVVHSNRATFFPPGHSNIATVFIAWLNLDLGFESCFFNGMDAYYNTWMQFAFPLYIWSIVITMIVSAHYSTLAGRLFGKNSVKVLATLLLLSYAKMQRTTIASLSFTVLSYPDGSNQAVWLQDPNIVYLKGKHIPLFVAGLGVLLLLSIPYTLLLLFVKCLFANGDHRMLHWATRIRPFLDAYTGPYMDKYCFWTGLLLVFLNLLFLFFVVNILGDPALNLVAIGSTSLLVLIIALGLKGIYKKWPLDILEAFFFLNLGVTSYATLYANLSQTNNIMLATVAYVSTGLTGIVFMGIVIYHAYIQISSSRMWKRLKREERRRQNITLQEVPDEEDGEENVGREVRQQVFYFNELREPVLDYSDN